MRTGISWHMLAGGIGLLFILCVPTFTPAAHEILHLHDHHHCKNHKEAAHLSSADIRCDLCDYLMSCKYVSEDLDPAGDFIMPGAIAADTITSVWAGTLTMHFNLRGPPEV